MLQKEGGDSQGGAVAKAAAEENTLDARIHVMLALQEEMNCIVHPQWKTQGYAWHRALWLECAELLEHCSWKWWKQQETDLMQVRLEAVDIWHFGLSALLAAEAKETAAGAIAAGLRTTAESLDVSAAVEALVLHVLRERTFSVPLFHCLMHAIDMDFDDLYARYVGKNVLNLFRQRHGYRDGSYRKQWNGREDNCHLEEIMARCDPAHPDFRRLVEEGLQERYQALSAVDI